MISKFIWAVFLGTLVGCDSMQKLDLSFLNLSSSSSDEIILTEIEFSDLSGWQEDRIIEVFPAFLHSCKALKSSSPNSFSKALGYSPNWQKTCAAAALVKNKDATSIRNFFETYFTAYQVNNGETGLFTGYYEPILRASPHPDQYYTVPIYRRPDDLTVIDLGGFDPQRKGEKIVARLDENDRVHPYYTRSEIDKGILDGRGLEIAWADDLVDVYFLHVQGMGILHLCDGRTLRVGYDTSNGHKYESIGKFLVAKNELKEDQISMQAIRAWLDHHPEQVLTTLNHNPSYIFFHVTPGHAPLGRQGVPLTAGRSLAVDPAFIPFGTPLWLEVDHPDQGSLKRLVIAQDAGSAIKGPVRGDFFWGTGQEAGRFAGNMKSYGIYSVLVPKASFSSP